VNDGDKKKSPAGAGLICVASPQFTASSFRLSGRSSCPITVYFNQILIYGLREVRLAWFVFPVT
jgi:hypothetical protein